MAAWEFLWQLITTFSSLIAAPFQSFDMLWIIVPVYLNWVFTEIYQEKHGTSLGNAISNGVVALWVGIDWARTSVNFFMDIKPTWSALLLKLLISLIMVVYGLVIIIWGIKAKKTTRLIGRIREVTYFTFIFTPIIYGAIGLDWMIFLTAIIFFPIFYFLVELLLRFVPNPTTYEEEEKEELETLEKEGKVPSSSPQPDYSSPPGNYPDYPSTYPSAPSSTYPPSSYPPRDYSKDRYGQQK